MGIDAELFCDNNKTKLDFGRLFNIEAQQYSHQISIFNQDKLDLLFESLRDRNKGLTKKETLSYFRKVKTLHIINFVWGRLFNLRRCIKYVKSLKKEYKVYVLTDDEIFEDWMPVDEKIWNPVADYKEIYYKRKCKWFHRMMIDFSNYMQRWF